MQIKVLPFEHNCSTTKLVEGKMATQDWVADRIGDWIKRNPQKGAKDAKDKLESEYGVKLKYSKAWSGMKLALEQIHGKYEDSFQYLFNWKAEIELRSPGSIVEINLQKVGEKVLQKDFCCFEAMHRWFFGWLQTIHGCGLNHVDWQIYRTVSFRHCSRWAQLAVLCCICYF